jgi:hypothetical protein
MGMCYHLFGNSLGIVMSQGKQAKTHQQYQRAFESLNKRDHAHRF